MSDVAISNRIIIIASALIFICAVGIAPKGFGKPSKYNGFGNSAGEDISNSLMAPAPPSDVSQGDSYIVPALGAKPPLTIQIILKDDYYADVIFQNRLALIRDTSERINFHMDIGVVTVWLYAGDGDAPDTMVVVPPPGYYTIPADVLVEEDEIGIIRIYEGGLS